MGSALLQSGWARFCLRGFALFKWAIDLIAFRSASPRLLRESFRAGIALRSLGTDFWGRCCQRFVFFLLLMIKAAVSSKPEHNHIPSAQGLQNSPRRGPLPLHRSFSVIGGGVRASL